MEKRAVRSAKVVHECVLGILGSMDANLGFQEGPFAVERLESVFLKFCAGIREPDDAIQWLQSSG